MSKIKIIISVIVVIIAILALLFFNKSKMKEKTKSLEQINKFAVRTVVVQKEKLGFNLFYTGNLTAQKDIALLSETQGKVLKVNFNIGQYVKAGEVLALIDDEMKQAAFIAAEANFEKTRKDFDRYQQLFIEKSINESQFDIARLAFKSAESQFIIAQRQLNDTKIKAPFSGIVTSRPIETGSFISPGSLITNLIDITVLKLKLNIPEKDAYKLKIGDDAKITSEVIKTEIFGKVKTINYKADESHTILVEIDVPNSSLNLKAGLFARAEFNKQNNSESLTIPRESLVGSIKKPQVFVVVDNVAHLKNIRIAETLFDKVEVLEGLNAGDIVVQSGQINIKDNSQVQIFN